jgi:hypothetical protein
MDTLVLIILILIALILFDSYYLRENYITPSCADYKKMKSCPRLGCRSCRMCKYNESQEEAHCMCYGGKGC